MPTLQPLPLSPRASPPRFSLAARPSGPARPPSPQPPPLSPPLSPPPPSRPAPSHTRVPPFHGEFSSWEAFARAFDEYQRATFQLYRVRTTNSVAQRNRAIERLAREHGREPELLDAAMRYYTKMFVCTHAGAPKSRSTGRRKGHQLRATDCGARLYAILARADGSNTYKVRVRAHDSVHNHDVGPDRYYSYAEGRRVTAPGLRLEARRMWERGSSQGDIATYLREASGKPVTRRDVGNLILKWKRDEERGETDDWMMVTAPPEYRQQQHQEGGDEHNDDGRDKEDSDGSQYGDELDHHSNNFGEEGETSTLKVFSKKPSEDQREHASVGWTVASVLQHAFGEDAGPDGVEGGWLVGTPPEYRS